MSTKPIWIRLTEQDLAALDAVRRKEDRTRANMLLQLVRQALANQQATS